jgi:hypothetical protein
MKTNPNKRPLQAGQLHGMAISIKKLVMMQKI